ncbi:hypothetical protein GYMLUDRAFT_58994 [Collybiopsis luxurians FD-317 M1]|uniref:Uncharacterized protein n=1 Tax=Collybiopsis luxurians FD-317 M1 TaxID=944289 RepID=A0A0D0BYW2_9AGAR|nr:hypothetical protein GYMLUDRAFT_58994 [Collybiopsis luxurians FD-317 M1]
MLIVTRVAACLPLSASAPVSRVLTEEECSNFFLEPAEIKFSNSPEGLQDMMFRECEWKYMKPFLSPFPTQSLPEHFFWTPGKERPDYKFLWGWATAWEQVYNLVENKFPNAVRRFKDEEPNDVGTSLDAAPLIAESTFTGPRMFGFEGPPMWVVIRTCNIGPVRSIKALAVIRLSC